MAYRKAEGLQTVSRALFAFICLNTLVIAITLYMYIIAISL